jgi:hypothetical protein
VNGPSSTPSSATGYLSGPPENEKVSTEIEPSCDPRGPGVLTWLLGVFSALQEPPVKRHPGIAILISSCR